MTYDLAGLGIVLLAACYHGFTEHHWLLKYFWRYARPGTVVPLPRHDTRWHAAGHGRRAAANAAMVLAAAGIGLALQLQPRVAVVTLAAVAVMAVTVPPARRMSRALGERYRPADVRDEED